MPEVWPIAMTEIDWKTYINQVKYLTGVSPVKSLNDAREKVEGPAAFIRSRMKFGLPDLRHVMFTFLMQIPESDLDVIAYNSGLAVDSMQTTEYGDSIALVSGSLDCWKNAFLALCVRMSSDNLLHIFNKIHLYFEQAGLGPAVRIPEAHGTVRIFHRNTRRLNVHAYYVRDLQSEIRTISQRVDRQRIQRSHSGQVQI